METVNVRAGFLCNHEVLAILRQQRDARTKEIKALGEAKVKRVAKLGRKPFNKEQEDDEVERIQPQDLHTVTFECIKYLEEPVHPLRRQTNASINKLLDELEKLDLTKAERLQILNLAPTTLVALVVCVDDFEERFQTPEEQEHILTLVKEHLGAEDAATAHAHAATNGKGKAAGDDVMEVEEEEYDAMEDEGLVDEGTGQGAMEAEARDIDEVDA
ncbi:RNA polymerase Rpb4-domain-containing protein [Leucosporidium creatinivorum]|uniref:DNA-directed RNA polymerase III subunit RPC9 n=1 Tax=Leucosporidium creatinivorum TaxID=106004 RepID=A0A1Y2FWD2_9BASI|nr:RNA polymerase Rpb4-domain-containing protein [Leucosporidium creatinivorum]